MAQVDYQKTEPDYKYNNAVLEKFIHHVMQGGEKSTAQSVVYSALEEVSDKLEKQPMQIFSQAVKNASPDMEVKSRRVGGANYQVPVRVTGDRRKFLAMQWIIEAARKSKKQKRSMKDALVDELIAAYNDEGSAVKKKENMHKMAEANQAFAYLAW